MIFPGPLAVQLTKVKERDQPIMFVFAFYDKIFFTHTKKRTGNLRTIFLAMQFNLRTKAELDKLYVVIQEAKADYLVAVREWKQADMDAYSSFMKGVKKRKRDD